jgi:hypothetical protein
MNLSKEDRYEHFAYIGRVFKVLSQTGSVAIVEDNNGCKMQVEVQHLRKIEKKKK